MHHEHGQGDDEADDLASARTPLASLVTRVRGALALVLALALVVPSTMWLADELAFRSSGDAVTDALGEDAALADALVLVRSTRCDGRVSSGSGFALDLGAGPVIVTNRHVVDDAARIGVRPLAGGPALTVADHRISATADVAVLELQDDAQPPAVLRPGHDAVAGDLVRVVGFPGGQPTLREGTVERATDGRLELDLPTAPGASGSPVLDGDGHVVGQVHGRTEDGGGIATSLGRLLEAVRTAVPAPAC